MGPKQKKLSNIAIATHMGWSRSYLSSPRFKGRPDFYDLKDFELWYGSTTSRTPKADALKNDASAALELPPIEDTSTLAEEIESSIRLGDFDELMLEDCGKVAQQAYYLYEKAVKSGSHSRVSVALKNWTEATKQACSVRERFLKMMLKRGEVLNGDLILNLLGVLLQQLHLRFTRLGTSTCNEANPENPTRAQKAVDDAVNKLLEEASDALTGLEAELKSHVETS